MPSYMKADGDAHEVAQRVLHNFPDFKHLIRVEMTFQVIFAYPTLDAEGEPKGPAIKHNGYPARATIKINSHKDRVAGLPDVTITVDGDWYGQANDRQRQAIFFHEFLHIELKTFTDKVTGEEIPDSDDAGRPKLKMRLHDMQIGVFAQPMKIFGADSGDLELVHEFIGWAKKEEIWVQGELDFVG